MAKIKTAPRHRGHDHPFKPRKISTRAFKQVYWPYLPVILIVGFLSSLGFGPSGFKNSIKHPNASVLSYAASMQEQTLLADTNAERTRLRLPPLNLNLQLDQAADEKAKDMAARNYWSHDTPDGNPPWVFVSNQKYSYQKLGENLAAGFDNEHSTVNGWMASRTHKENLLDPNFTEVGFGTAQSTNYTAAGGGPMTIVVAFYGKPATSASPISRVQGDATPSSVSLAQLAVAKLPVVGLATNLAILLAASAILIWLGRHFVALKRALRKGEKFVFSHPLLDVGLVTIAALSYLLTRTAGLIH
ncbi:hypothetical protein HYS84_01830 [Candidatus Saccharibacteria bacterium]|nr:hypothetical protein [Candidatus Saccharibacteria bacterium]